MMTNMAERDRWPLGDYVRSAREQLGWSQAQAAKQIGVSPSTWASIETGTRTVSKKPVSTRPDADNVMAAANLLGLEVDRALKLGGYDPAYYNPSTRSRPSVSVRQLAEEIRQLPEEERYAMYVIVQRMRLATGEEPAEPIVTVTEHPPAPTEETPDASRRQSS